MAALDAEIERTPLPDFGGLELMYNEHELQQEKG
jgi:hypothetical protein